MNTKNEPKSEQNAPQGTFPQTSMIFQEILEVLNKTFELSKDSPYNSEPSNATKQNCKFCHHQRTCILHESATDFAINMINVTEERQIINLFEPLNLFCAHSCGGFARIPDPLIP